MGQMRKEIESNYVNQIVVALMSDYLTLVMEKDIEKSNTQGEFKFRNQNPGAYSVIMMRSKRSFVWNHYTIEKAEDGSEKAVCKYCNTMIKFKNGATSGLINHLKNMHQLMRDSNGQVSNDSDQLEDSESSAKKTRISRQYEDLALPTKSKNGATYMKLGRLFSGVREHVAFDEGEDTPAPYSDKNFTAYLIRFILRNGLSFDIVKSKDFINLVKHLNPEAVVPSHENLLKELEACFPINNS